MADAKKDAKGKKDESEGGKDHFSEVMLFLFVIFFLWLAYNRLSYYAAIHGGSVYGIVYSIRDFFAYTLWPTIKVFSVVISLAAVIGINFVYRKLIKLNKEEQEIYGPSAVPLADGGIPQLKNEKWEMVIEHINSPDPADWRLAIIEADIMLDELLKVAGYHGDTLGERLKSVEKSDFLTIESAWEAHKTRNKIAHQGSDFPLNEREAKYAIAQFESVFKEFKII